ncbi:nitronate monooxygenase [Aeromicrobium sp. 636]|uniref:Nitronate monooxygenase n=1 Tax=Aeromicrobium senzhongii TaxID=2663859 RepID=A0A8I0EWX3_9ACTN|nr:MULTISPECIES: nitronate monooxygenase family protein [Aeromicrobium]MBC9226565.1 nitronate monooxygenase [Aeromicrobium senzhongii]MCQ3998666.1 nitronate monooxygenase [Aeromicrobium sp. 636]
MSLPAVLQNRLSLPVVASPMFIASGPDLVIAQCKAGIVGSFPALNARPASMLGEWLDRIEDELAGTDAAPFAVNQIVHRSNNRLEEDMATIVEHRVPIVITSLGARPEINDAVHSYGGIVLHDIINDRFARKAIEKGADGLIAVAAGAGGHAGTLSPFALLQEIRQWFDGPLLLSGSIAHGRSVLAAQAAGADLAYVGSAFLATDEANVVDDYKQMIVDSSADDIVYSSLFTGVHGNYLRGSIEAAGLDPRNLPQGDPTTMDFGSGSTSDAKAWKDIWGAGQGLGVIDATVPAADLVARLRREYEEARRELLAAVPV